MNTPLVLTLQELLRTGDTLIPLGGSEFSGYNAKRQSGFLLWRKNCLDAIGLLKEKGAALYSRIANDENGMYFYQSSAQNISTIVSAALEIAMTLPGPVVQTAQNAPEPHSDGSVDSAPNNTTRGQTPPPREQEPTGADALRDASEPPEQSVTPERFVTHEQPATPEQSITPERFVTPERSVTVEPAVADTNGDTAAAAPRGGDDSGIDDERPATVTPVVIFSSSAHPALEQLTKFFTEHSIACALYTHTEGAWNSLASLHESRPLPRYAVFLLSEEHRSGELIALGYLAGKYPWLTLCCIHRHTLSLPALLSGISHKEFVHTLDEITFGVVKELKTAGYSVSL